MDRRKEDISHVRDSFLRVLVFAAKKVRAGEKWLQREWKYRFIIEHNIIHDGTKRVIPFTACCCSTVNQSINQSTSLIQATWPMWEKNIRWPVGASARKKIIISGPEITISGPPEITISEPEVIIFYAHWPLRATVYITLGYWWTSGFIAWCLVFLSVPT